MPARWVAGPAPVVALVAAAGVAGALVTALGGELTDLEVYRAAGRAVLDGQPLTSVRQETGLPFTYPPFAAAVMVPLAVVPAVAAGALLTAASGAALATVVWMVLGELGRARPGWLVALLSLGALALEPVWQNLTFGQVNLLLMAAVVVDVLRPERRWSGVLMGLAAGVKLTPLVFVVLLVLVGRRTAAVRALAVFAATVAAGMLIAPGGDYWGSRLTDASRVGPPALAHNQSVYGVLTRLLDHEPAIWLWIACGGTTAVVSLLLGAWWWRRDDRLLGACLAAVAMLVVSPVAWSHHWVWAVPLALLLWHRVPVLGAAVAAVFVTRPFVWLPWGDGAEYGWSWWQHLVGDAYVWCSLGVVVWAAQAARPSDAPREPTYAAGAGS